MKQSFWYSWQKLRTTTYLKRVFFVENSFIFIMEILWKLSEIFQEKFLTHFLMCSADKKIFCKTFKAGQIYVL